MTDKTDLASAGLVDGMMDAALVAGALAAAAPADRNDSKMVHPRRFTIVTDPKRDALLTDFGKETLDDRYLLPGETYQDLFARVADAYADDQDHAQRLYDYISPVVHARNARSVERRHRARPADLVLPQHGRGQP
jgi:ribonucleoside-diphosphate reductase alpha chain